MRGVVSYTKTGSQAWAEGQLVYWDGSVFTTGGGFLAGFATKAVAGGAGDTTGELYLDGIPKDDTT
jgi:predicted RecA/RadA family phage recombinase